MLKEESKLEKISKIGKRILATGLIGIVLGSGCENKIEEPTYKLDNIVNKDSTSLESMGLETFGGIYTPLIKKGSSLPAETSEVFSTAEDFQTQITIHLLRGDKPLVKENTSIGYYRINSIHKRPRGEPQIEITFSITEEGYLKISAKDLRTGEQKKILYFKRSPF